MKRGHLIQAASCQRYLLVLTSSCGAIAGCRSQGNDFFHVIGNIPAIRVKPTLNPCRITFFLFRRKRVDKVFLLRGHFLDRTFCRNGPIAIEQKFLRVFHNLGNHLEGHLEQRLDPLGDAIVYNFKHTNAPSLRANGQHFHITNVANSKYLQLYYNIIYIKNQIRKDRI